jgi:hypothetical protein
MGFLVEILVKSITKLGHVELINQIAGFWMKAFVLNIYDIFFCRCKQIIITEVYHIFKERIIFPKIYCLTLLFF